MFGICNLSIVPCRKEASHRSEMVNQLLFGETFEILDREDTWIKIRTSFDNYECWIDEKQFIPIDKEGYKKANSNDTAVSGGLIELITRKQDNLIFPIVLGSNLPGLKKSSCQLGAQEYLFEGSTTSPQDKKSLRNSIAETAFLYLNSPYLWGGRSPFGIDCSGFSQLVYKLNRLKIKRDAHQQAIQGSALSFVEESEEGDLAFFDNEDGRIIHVGIILQENKIIHAAGKVRVDKFDHYGIYNADTKKYSHRLRIIKRYF
jgi:hypothetical protein